MKLVKMILTLWLAVLGGSLFASADTSIENLMQVLQKRTLKLQQVAVDYTKAIAEGASEKAKELKIKLAARKEDLARALGSLQEQAQEQIDEWDPDPVTVGTGVMIAIGVTAALLTMTNSLLSSSPAPEIATDACI